MTVFWFTAVVMILAALLFVLPPLIWPRREGWWLAPVTAVLLPAIAVGWYLKFGAGPAAVSEPQSVHPKVMASKFANQQAGSMQSMIAQLERRLEVESGDARGWALLGRSYDQLNLHEKADAAYARAAALGFDDAKTRGERVAAAADNPHIAMGQSTSPHDIEEATERLESRLKTDPGDASAWMLLGRSYQRMSRYEDASEAFRKAAHLTPEDAQLWADYADALAMMNGGQLAGSPVNAVKKALELDPENRKALWLAATAALQEQHAPSALEYWRKLQAITPNDSPDRSVIAANIEEARNLAISQTGSAGEAGVRDTERNVAADVPVEIRGVLSVDSALESKISDNDTVFIFARAVGGPKIPLAVVRKQAKDLPITFVLNDEMAMTPAFKLSKFSQVVVGARISKSGNANAQPGDLTGTSEVIDVGKSEAIRLVIQSQES